MCGSRWAWAWVSLADCLPLALYDRARVAREEHGGYNPFGLLAGGFGGEEDR
jgi:copper oxidase (laccase) domain-containing protein